jgi:uncharacterized YigZ family protein
MVCIFSGTKNAYDLKDSYLMINKPAQGLFKVKGSKFISMAWPVNSEHEINTILKKTKKDYYDARHHCYAWKLQSSEGLFRADDDGEPSGTAGKPILGQINSRNLENILLVVVRYFGGILLGTGGLAKAYKNAAASALDNAVIIENIISDTLLFQLAYSDLKPFMKIACDLKAECLDQKFEMDCHVKMNIRKSQTDFFLLALKNKLPGRIKIIKNKSENI